MSTATAMLEVTQRLGAPGTARLLWTGIGIAVVGGLLLAAAALMLVRGLRGPQAPSPAH